MKAIICGSRTGLLSHANKQALSAICAELDIDEIVTGGAPGIDEAAKMWAINCRMKTAEFHADWAAHGKYAGPYRNAQMARYADICIALPGGRGTEDMVRQATERGLIVLRIDGVHTIFDSRSHTPPASPPSPDTPGSDGFAGRAEG